MSRNTLHTPALLATLAMAMLSAACSPEKVEHRFFYIKYAPSTAILTKEGAVDLGQDGETYRMQPPKGCIIPYLPSIKPIKSINTPGKATWIGNIDGQSGTTYGYTETSSGRVELLHHGGKTYIMAEGSLNSLDNLYNDECLE